MNCLVFLDHRGTRRYFTGPHGGLSPNREHAARLTAEVAEKWRATFRGAYIGTVGVEPAGDAAPTTPYPGTPSGLTTGDPATDARLREMFLERWPGVRDVVLGGPVDTEVTADRAQEDRDDERRDRYFSQRRRNGGGE